jgi:hypothetical protein
LTPDVNASLGAVEAGESENLAKSKEALGALWGAAEPVVLLYGVVSQCLWKREDAGQHEGLYGISAFLLSAQRSAVLGGLTVGRIHLQESNYFTRRCLELVGFSYHAWSDPKALLIWLHAGRGDAAYETYQQKFGPKRLHEDLRQIDASLPDAYESCNRMIHSSLFSIAQSFERAKVQGGEEQRVHFFDAQTNAHWPRVALELLKVLDIHLKSTSGLARRMLQGPAAREARKVWKHAYEPAAEGFRTQRDRWRGRIEAYRRTRPTR